jgi:hypothetical protein
MWNCEKNEEQAGNNYIRKTCMIYTCVCIYIILLSLNAQKHQFRIHFCPFLEHSSDFI